MGFVKCANPKCYARALGECSTDITREHYMPLNMSQVVGKEEIFVRNLVFNKPGEWVRRSPKDFQAWILCQRHNNNYSGLDTAGGTVLSALDRINATLQSGGGAHELVTVNGDDLERCLLKIMMGGVYSGAYPTAGESKKKVLPPEEWVRIVFKGESFRPGQGLYVLLGGGESVEEKFATTPNMLRPGIIPHPTTGEITGLFLGMVGVNFVLYLGDDPQTCPTLNDSLYRPAGIVVIGSNTQIQFQWREPGDERAVTFAYTGPGELPPNHDYPSG